MRTSTIVFSVVFGAVQMLAQKTPPPAPGQIPPTGSQSSTQANPATAQKHTAAGIPSNRARNSEEAEDLLDATDQARNAVLDNNKQDALEHINHALQNANEIEQRRNGRMVPIYSELSRFSVIEPIMRARQENQENGQLQNSSRSSQQSPSAQTQTYSSNSQNRRSPVAVRQVEGEYTAVNLDVQAAKDHLQAARQALSNGDFQKADVALKAVQDGVSVVQVSADLPLVKARENLMIAHEAASEGHSRETQAALKEASKALTDYCNEGGSHQQPATQVRTEIDNYAKSSTLTGSDASSKIADWWNQLASWNQGSQTTGAHGF